MKPVFITLMVAGLHFINNVQAQVTPNVLNTAGNSSSTANIFLESNFGESFIGQGTSGSYLLLTHGFLQPNGGTAPTPPPIPSLPVNGWYEGLDNAGNSVVVNNIFLESSLGEWMTTARTGGTYMLTQGILQPGNMVNNPLPVLGLEFFAKRLNPQVVQLDWKTVQEINNRGFSIERRKENEPQFAVIGFERSLASGGNSGAPLAYQKLDDNGFAGSTYYRLKQEDNDGRFTYSAVRLVAGSHQPVVVMKAWPVPAVSHFNLQVQGLSRGDAVQVFDAGGRLVKTVPVANAVTVSIGGLTPGTYLLRLASDAGLYQKVIVQ